jgi:uncharacterized Zn finger protein
MFNGFGWKPYVSAAVRRLRATSEMAKLRKKGHPVSPVVIEGRTIARTFWGKAWCDNLERYSDYANRLPRGRTYARNGSVIDLQIAPGEVKAMVSGSDIYQVRVIVAPLSKLRWKSICTDCAGAIDSLVELLQGRFSKGVMERVCQQTSGLFPSPREINLSCSCPDWADMCKHVAAVLYGIGARLDQQPELLFRLHRVDEKELIAKAGNELPLSKKGPAAAKVLSGSEDLSALFGLDMAQNTISDGKPAVRMPSEPKRPQKPIAAAGALTATAVTKKKPAVKQTSKAEQHRVKLISLKRKSEAQRAKWAARKKAVESQVEEKKPVAKHTAPNAAKGGITAAERKRLAELAKARWAEYKHNQNSARKT